MENGITISEKTLVIIAIVVLLFLAYIFWWNYQRSEEIKKLRDEKREAELSYLKLLEDYLSKTKSIPESLKLKLEDLKATYAFDENIEAELTVAIELLNDGKETIAVEKLTKIIENVLKQRVANEADGENRKRRTFMEAIREGVKLDVITGRLETFLNALRVLRNEEAHELNVQINQNETAIYLLTCVHILYELAGTKKETT